VWLINPLHAPAAFGARREACETQVLRDNPSQHPNASNPVQSVDQTSQSWTIQTSRQHRHVACEVEGLAVQAFIGAE